jgi:hypothetical protein
MANAYAVGVTKSAAFWLQGLDPAAADQLSVDLGVINQTVAL